MAVTTCLARRGDCRIAIIGAGVAGLTLADPAAPPGKGLASACSRRGRARQLGEGAFLTLAPNGINALRALGLAERIAALGMPTLGFEIMNGAGRRLVHHRRACSRCARPAPKASRCAAPDLLGRTAGRGGGTGAEISFGHALDRARRASRTACVLALRQWRQRSMQPGWPVATVSGRRRRRLCFPGAPDPLYTGLTGTGGLLDLPGVPADRRLDAHGVRQESLLRLHEAEATAGILVRSPSRWTRRQRWRRPDPPSNWRQLGSPAACRRPRRRSARSSTRDRRISRAAIRCSTCGICRAGMTGRVVLLGDAAHAVSPHTGQGASMAIEDAVVLAACLDATPLPAQAFAAFQALRQDRVEHIVKISRRIGSQKQVKGRVGAVPARPDAAALHPLRLRARPGP